MSANRALFDCFICGASWAEMAWRTLITTFFLEVDGILLRRGSHANMTLFTRHTAVNIKIGARLAVLGSHTSSLGAG